MAGYKPLPSQAGSVCSSAGGAVGAVPWVDLLLRQAQIFRVPYQLTGETFNDFEGLEIVFGKACELEDHGNDHP